MPKIVIKEYDNTTAGAIDGTAFSVVVPGFVSSTASSTVFDANDIYECSSQEDFVNNVGMVAATDDVPHYGNQIAYLLLGLGYTVLYLKITTMTELIDETKWEALKDKSIYDFRYLVSGLIKDLDDNVTLAAVNKIMTNIASNDNTKYETSEGRGDCIALLDISKAVYSSATGSTAITAIQKAADETSQYAAYFAPTVIYQDTIFSSSDAKTGYNSNTELPASFHYLVCAAYALNNYAEWYAVAGYTRGIGSLNVKSTSIKLGDAAINALQPRTSSTGGASVNLVIYLNGSYYIWGNRTSYELDSEGLVASHFLNIRQLCCTLKKEVYTACRQLMFEPNDDALWLNFVGALTPILEEMKLNQGIKDYRFEKKTTSLKAKLFAAIRIVPIEAVEDFEIGISLEDSLDDTTITIKEHLTN